MIGLLLWSMLAAVEPDGGAAPTAEQLRFFETSIRPLLVENCHKCHGPKKQWASLRLDSRAAMLRGGDSGPAIVPGKPDESRLILAVRQVDEDLKMPEDGKLTDRQIADLARWVEMGAPYPAAAEEGTPKRDPNHWAFQPPADPPVPAVKNAAWATSPIDHFVLARLEAAGCAPAPPADKPTLIRRVTFDLVGLPPTPAEIEAFLADEQPDAFARLVDRLLASPAYGERWGRHWLDVARYADSNGLDENVAHGNAWRYRDYVVAAFNSDKPYDRFVLEQLAGDLLSAADDRQRHEQLIATGLLVLGPKVLAEADKAKMQMDIVDEQIDTVGRALVGLTLGCARCHDHKFDPIDSVDYYGLAGIFKSTRTMESLKTIARWYEHPLRTPQIDAEQVRFDQQLAAKKKAIDILVAISDGIVRETATPGTVLPDKLEPLYSSDTQAELKTLRDELAQFEKSRPEVPSAMGVTDDQIADVAIHIRGNPQKLGDVVARHVPPVVQGPTAPHFSAGASGRRELAEWLVDPRHPLTSRVIVNRVWRWHFGRGLSLTPDNFGLLGDRPSHPELLDWLAHRLMAGGWSIKSLHRLILNSSTYQQSSLPSAATAAHDPENRLLGRANVQRLEAEQVRDALLVVGGQLDESRGGSLLKTKNREFLFDHTSKDTTDYHSRRRSLYLPVIRNNLYDLFQLLDYPDAAIPSGNRATTTIAPQALLMLNSEFVVESAGHFAERVQSETASDEGRVRRMYQIAYGRAATSDELAATAAFLETIDRALSATVPDAGQRRRQAWNVLCHVIVAANEFVYVQ
jgi:mono/diheme cytochrome c family protein